MKINEIITNIKNNLLIFKKLFTIYKNDKDVVLAAVQQNKCFLYYASKEIQNKIGEKNPVEYFTFAILKEKKQNLKNKLTSNLNVFSNITTKKIKI